MVVGTLNSSIVVGSLKSSIKCYIGAWAMGARQVERQGARQGARWEQDRFAASCSPYPHMVVGTLNSSMMVGTLKSNIKCYMGAWAKRARQVERQGSRQGARQGVRWEQDKFAASCSPCPHMVVGTFFLKIL